VEHFPLFPLGLFVPLVASLVVAFPQFPPGPIFDFLEFLVFLGIPHLAVFLELVVISSKFPGLFPWVRTVCACMVLFLLLGLLGLVCGVVFVAGLVVGNVGDGFLVGVGVGFVGFVGLLVGLVACRWGL